MLSDVVLQTLYKLSSNLRSQIYEQTNGQTPEQTHGQTPEQTDELCALSGPGLWGKLAVEPLDDSPAG